MEAKSCRNLFKTLNGGTLARERVALQVRGDAVVCPIESGCRLACLWRKRKIQRIGLSPLRTFVIEVHRDKKLPRPDLVPQICRIPLRRLRQLHWIPLAEPDFFRTLAAADFSFAAGALRGMLPAGLSVAVHASGATAAGSDQEGAVPGTACRS
jgi:hypothetical protein